MRTRLLLFLFACLGMFSAGAQPCRQLQSELVTYSASNGPAGGSAQYGGEHPSMSHDGRYVAFNSRSTSLVSYPVNIPNGGNVFVRDRETGQITVVDNSTPGSGWVSGPGQHRISGDGRWLLFSTLESIVIPNSGDTNNTNDVYIRDLRSARFERVSVPDINVTEKYGFTQGKHGGHYASMSGDGRRVAFSSQSKHLDTWWFTPDGEEGTLNISHIFVRDRESKRTWQVSRGIKTDGTAEGLNGTLGSPVMSADGQTVYFLSNNTNIDGPRRDPNDPTDDGYGLFRAVFNSGSDKWIVDKRVPVKTAWTKIEDIAVSPNGRFVAYVAANGIGDFADVVVYDFATGNSIRPRGNAPLTYNHGASRPFLTNEGVAWEDSIDYTDGTSHGGTFYRDLLNPAAPYIRIGRQYDGAVPWSNGLPGGPVASLDGRIFAFFAGNYYILGGYGSGTDDNGANDTFVQTNTLGTTECAAAELTVFDGLNYLNAAGTDVHATPAAILADTDHRAAVGIAADGAARIVLRAVFPQAGTVTFDASYPASAGCAAATPTLRMLDSSAQAATLNVQTVPVGDGRHVAFVVLLAPDDFTRANAGGTCADTTLHSRPLTLGARMLLTDGTTRIVSRTIDLRRPPVALVHGIWSSPKTWKWPVIEEGLYRARLVDYSDTDGESFAVNVIVVGSQVEELIESERGFGIAVARADVFAHSMGAVLIRHWAAGTFNSSPRYRHETNYQRGRVHRFVPVNSPQFGAEIANVLYAAAQGNSFRAQSLRILSAIAKRNPGGHALRDLRTPPLSELTRWVAPTDITGHVMTGDGGDLGLFPESLGLSAGALFLRPFGVKQSDVYANCPDDGTVALYSQQANLPAQFRTEFHGENSLHTNVTDDHDGDGSHQARALTLLNTPLTTNFSTSMPIGPTTTVNCGTASPIDGTQQYIGLVLNITGNRVTPGQQIVATIAAVGTFAPTRGFIYTSRGEMYEATGNPLAVTITVPVDATGELVLIAAASDNNGNAALSPPRGLVVDPSANITAINIPERDSIGLDATIPTRTLRPVASFVDGKTRAIVNGAYENYGASRSLTFTSSDPSVVRVTAKGQLVAQKAGNAVITIASTNGAPTNATVIVTGSAVTACNDGIDNDGDGTIDTADAGCATAAGLTELTGLTACNDGLDNDADGSIDMADVQCTSATVNFEHQPPAPGFTYSCTGLTCTLTGRALAPRPIATYAWSFGDGVNPIGESVTRTFAAYGAYPVTLTAVDSDGQSGVASGVIIVDGALPIARFTFTCSGLTCTFDGSSSTDDVGLAAYAWDFGDGTTATGVNASKTYTTAGSRTVTLTVTDRANKIDDEKKYVITSSAPASVPLRYVTVAPCRFYDSRTAPNTKLATGTERIINVANTPCGTPSAIRAVSLAMVILEPTGDGFLRMYAPGASTEIPVMNFTPAAAPRAGNAIVPVAADGTIAIKPFVAGTGGATHVILDIQGFFVDQPAAPSLGFASLTPCRLLDTRSDAAPDGQLRPINSGETRELLVQGSPKNCGVPAGAQAVAANLTAIAMTNGGHLKLFPAGMALPGTSNVNYKADRAAIGSSARSTLAALPRATDLAIHALLPSGGSVHAAVDVSGYFSASAPLRYYPIAPCRSFDTRLALQAPRFAHNETRALQIRGNCGVPADAKSAMVSLTVVSPTTYGHLLAWDSGVTRPVASTINFLTGEYVISNGAIVPLSATQANDLSIFASAPSGTADVVVDVFGYFK